MCTTRITGMSTMPGEQGPNRMCIHIRTRRCAMRIHTFRTNIIGMNIDTKEA